MADAGVASRRACEELIERGAVEVNGRVVTRLPVFVNPADDSIVVEGRPLPRRRPGRSGGDAGAAKMVYVMLYKPPRTLTTLKDEGGRTTVADLVKHPSGARLYPVGRLDFETAGLVLMTNDGDLANRLTHPRYGVTKTYHAEVKGKPDEAALRSLERDIFRAGKRAARIAQVDGAAGDPKRTAHVGLKVLKSGTLAAKGDRAPAGGEHSRLILEITMAEGRNRQVSAVLARAGYTVKKLVCVGLGPLALRAVAAGRWRELDRREVRELKKAAAMAEKTLNTPASASANGRAAGKGASAPVPSTVSFRSEAP